MDEYRDGAPRLAELLERAWTHHGLKGVAIAVVQLPGEANRWTAVVQATVETERGAFGGLGEASAEGAAPGPGARLVEEAEARAVGCALGRATNSAAVLAARPPSPEESGVTPRVPAAGASGSETSVGGGSAVGASPAVPAWLRVEEGAGPAAVVPGVPATTGAGRDDAPAAGQPATRRVADRGGRVFATAQSLWKACAARRIAAPEPDPGWGETRLQEYVATWSAELKQAAGRQ